eukprot:CAMPEP_0115874590 /NCGR_PEP_ID=MMETSP0287-20121206/24624_1 /TAXON_ID=412157 /ORGANISM="Chrysochromulina rotalis, Strain UIO044" /LENGTH=67 /DNA_ID=CAMNT_0003329755 /DNA_START=30 /DNA_END=229 /DNA_ORIENTATION=-
MSLSLPMRIYFRSVALYAEVESNAGEIRYQGEWGRRPLRVGVRAAHGTQTTNRLAVGRRYPSLTSPV